MRDYGHVQTCFWTDHAIQGVSDAGKLLALYLLTGPHTTMLGCFRIPVGYVAEDLKWETEKVNQGFEELAKIGFLVRDAASGWVLIKNFLTWNPIENPNQGKSIAKLFEQIPSTLTFFKSLILLLQQHSNYLSVTFQDALQQQWDALERAERISKGFPNPSETVTEPFRNQEQEQKQDQEQEQEQEYGAEPCDVSALPMSATDFPITIPLHDKTEFSISASLVEEWQQLYPAVDVRQALRHIRGWNLANVSKRKTKSGVLRHITHWLANEQNRGGKQQAFKPPKRFQNIAEHNEAIAAQWLQQETGNLVEGEVMPNE